MILQLDGEGNMINKNGVLVKTTREEVMDLTCPFVIPNIDIDFSLDIVVTSGDSGRWVLTVCFIQIQTPSSNSLLTKIILMQNTFI